MVKTVKKTKSNDDAWITVHFEEIVNKYAGQHIIVSNEEIFTGDKAIEKARKKHPDIIPTSMPVPRPEDFVHILKDLKDGFLPKPMWILAPLFRYSLPKRRIIVDCCALTKENNGRLLT